MAHSVQYRLLTPACGWAVAMLLSACLEDRIVEVTYGQSVPVGEAGEGCAPAGAPSWSDPIESIMTAKCNMCHRESTSYENIQTWVTSGDLEEYCAMGSAHYLDDGQQQEACLQWLDIGAPEEICPP